MPTTNYSFTDLTNIVATSGPTFENAVDAGTAPLSANISGSFNDPGVNEVGVSSYFIRCRAFGRWTADVDHAGVIGAIPPGARITRVNVRQTFVSNPQSVDGDLTYVAGTPPYTTGCGVNIAIQMYPEPPNVLWQTDADEINVLVVDSAATNPGNVAASDTPPGEFIGAEYDFTTNPNGDFPDGYMSYADFITNFSQMKWLINTFSSVSGSPTAGLTNITGNVAGNCFAELTLWRMEVEWNMASSWTITSPQPLVLPDNVIVLERPEPLGDVDEEQIEKIVIGDTEITPDDPWVEIWTKRKIVLHLPTEDNYEDEPIIEIHFVGTEFEGSVSSIPFTVIYADLSGVYVLDDSIYHDVLYERTATPTTQEVEIPAPFFVTHFVNTPESDVCHYTGTRIRATGQGTLRQVLQSEDYINTLEFGEQVLRTSSNRSLFHLANFIDQHGAVRVYTNEIDDFMKVDQLLIFVKPIFTDYPR